MFATELKKIKGRKKKSRDPAKLHFSLSSTYAYAMRLDTPATCLNVTYISIPHGNKQACAFTTFIWGFYLLKGPA